MRTYLQEHVLLLRRQLIETALSSSCFNLSRGQTLLDVGGEPILGDFVEFACATTFAKPPLVEGQLLRL